MFKIIRLLLFCLIAVALPMQAIAQTQEQQKTELSISAKPNTHQRYDVHHRQKAVSHKKHHETKISLAEKIKLVRAIISEHLSDLRAQTLNTGIPTPVFVGVIAAESTNNGNAVSPKDAKGLGQTRDIADQATGIECTSFNPVCSI